ncbi:MAG: ComEC/Rec2 family competence protein [Solirubrobacterales bacterium]
MAVAAWLAVLAAVSALAGAALGVARLAAIDAGALSARPGTALETRASVDSLPREEDEGIEAEVETPAGRALLIAPHGARGIEPGADLAVRGRAAEPPPWRAARLRARGIATVIEAEAATPTGPPRGGAEGAVDAVRERAERALGRGMSEREAALARGFVLGQDDRIDPATREDFKRSGLAHLLAVSGQNVILLCLLAWPLLALCGLTLRARLLALLGLIALYVPLTGAGPSIQRAGAMGAAGLVAAMAGRPRSRWYALMLAAAATLALNPRAGADVGWQLSFAAVVGIFCWSRRIAALLGGDPDRGRGGQDGDFDRAGSPRRALAEGAAMTISATLATAPLMAHHFESLSVAALPANVIALPAVAPAMWLGMLAAMAGQLPLVPVEPLNWLGSLCLAYIAQVARWFGSPGWALLELRLEGAGRLACAYALLAALVEASLFAARRRRGLRFAGPRRRRRLVVPAGAALLALALVAVARAPDAGPPAAPPDALAVRVLDVGQGDAILLDPPAGEPVLVDAGPPGAGVAARLRELGVDRLAALVVTHDQADHAGGVPEVLASVPAGRLAQAAGGRELAALAAARGAEPLRVAEGDELRSGELRLSVLWPPRELLGAPVEDPNRLSVVVVAEWRHFSMLLTGDAEAAEVPMEPGAVDVVKVAHHGSADEGLAALLDRGAPKLAVISVGENPYGHPAPESLAALSSRGVPVARTDEAGELAIEADAAGWRLSG